MDLDEARERTIQALSTLFAEDRLTMEEFERRLDMMYKASTVAELQQLTAELPVLSAVPDTASPLAPSARRTRAPAVDTPGVGHIRAFMSESRRNGVWIVPNRLDVAAFLSTVKLDFRQALLAPGVTELAITAVMGNVSIIVPPGLRVEGHGNAVMGSFDNRYFGAPTTGAQSPVLRLTGFALMSEVKVRESI
jgi:uncharacterized coiled-coil protein SlyX